MKPNHRISILSFCRYFISSENYRMLCYSNLTVFPRFSYLSVASVSIWAYTNIHANEGSKEMKRFSFICVSKKFVTHIHSISFSLFDYTFYMHCVCADFCSHSFGWLISDFFFFLILQHLR